MRYYVVDAFTDELFKGNQAGVCLLDDVLPAEVMQSIAAENNLAETAFIVKRDGYYDLRWFSPEVEIDLCGHATLASAFIVSSFVDPGAETLRFETMSGPLLVTRKQGLFEMDFPTRRPEPVELTPLMSQAIGLPVLEAHLSRDLLLLVESEQQVRELVPDFALMQQIPNCFAVVVTAPGDAAAALGDAVTAPGGQVDFVSRFFAPGAGVPEDPVTGSSHCTLIPFWAERLQKDQLVARQLSKRGGTLYCENRGERVKIAGKAVLYLQGEILL
ncbi:MAG: PhzF family phenazine biosynthesis protein [Coriobacteriia bacterium]|nr:PhzF family phenazine biosynthesis protein [Coriobacteriia bacterium]